jgi:hypothetical protein
MSNEDFTDLNKIKDRIAKLLRMADDASSPNEAAIAASRARKLMDKYQLSQIDIGTGFEEEFATEPASRFFAAVPEYLSWFWTAIATYNDCQASYDYGWVDFKKKGAAQQWGRRVMFKGYKSDVALAKQMLNTLEEAVNRLCKEWLKTQGFARYPVREGGQFKHGAMAIITDRLRDMTKERDLLTASESATGTSLVVIKSTAVTAHFGEPGYKTSKARQITDAAEQAARNAGYRAGRMVEITKSVESE